jgi:aminoglycoside 3-N-acetyltransferase
MAAARHHYPKALLIDALRRGGIGAGDTASLQVSLGRLGLPEGATSTEAVVNLVIDAFLEVLGVSGTLIVPTYTYSIGRGETFDVESTPSTIGDFTEIFRKRPGTVRSRDPMLSSAGIGPNAELVLRTISKSCYGAGSTFDRLKEIDAKICTLGISLYWATFRHHIEEMADVPFRFKKRFIGQVRENGITREEIWTYFAAPYVENCEPVGLPLEKKARAAGLVAVEPVGRGELMAVGAREFFDFGIAELRKNAWLTAKGPACNVDELVRLEDARAGCRKLDAHLTANASIAQIIEGLIHLPRDTVSEGIDAALAALGGQYPLRVHQYPTGTQIGDDIVPEKWTCLDAYLMDEDGRRIFSLADDANHVPAGSWPFTGRVSRAELLDHLHMSAAQSNEVPFVSLQPRRQWGLCCSGRQAEQLHCESYEVTINSTFSYGTCKVGEAVVLGSAMESILMIARLDRRNDRYGGLAAAAVGIATVRALSASTIRGRTVRLLLVPGQIGLAAWLAANVASRASTVAVVMLDQVAVGSVPAIQDPSVLESSIRDEATALTGGPRLGSASEPIASVEALTTLSSRLVALISRTREESDR